MEREKLQNNSERCPYILVDANIINPQRIGTIVSYSDYISPKEKLSILIFVTIRYIRGKLCL